MYERGQARDRRRRRGKREEGREEGRDELQQGFSTSCDGGAQDCSVSESIAWIRSVIEHVSSAVYLGSDEEGRERGAEGEMMVSSATVSSLPSLR